MSALVSVKVEFKDAAAVLASLKELKYSAVEYSATGGLSLYNAETCKHDDKANAEIKVPTGPNSGYSDIGFIRGEDGFMTLSISDVDQMHMCRRAELPCRSYHSAERLASMDKLKQIYGKHMTLAEAANGNWETEVVEEGGEVRIQMSRWA